MISTKERMKRAAKVRKARKAKGISQEKLAYMSLYSLSHLQKLENATTGSQQSVDHYLGILRTYEA